MDGKQDKDDTTSLTKAVKSIITPPLEVLAESVSNEQSQRKRQSRTIGKLYTQIEELKEVNNIQSEQISSIYDELNRLKSLNKVLELPKKRDRGGDKK